MGYNATVYNNSCVHLAIAILFILACYNEPQCKTPCAAVSTLNILPDVLISGIVSRTQEINLKIAILEME
jgi:hypothetical protein